MQTRTAQALIRFGLGPRGDAEAADPEAWLRAQLYSSPAEAAPGPMQIEALSALRFDRENKPDRDARRSPPLYRRYARDFVSSAVSTTTPFRERLVWFWANHFSVSTRGVPGALIGSFIAEAIRPHVTGRFEAMLLAVMRHPAMLIYLNNATSVGPNSVAGRHGKLGLNENLARECLELHTVSPASGYTQTDVTNFAKILTGWSVDVRNDPPGFRFRAFRHEPEAQTLMGRRFGPGEAGGIAAVLFLARHRATHRHLATRLVRHFVADDPLPGEVKAIEAALRDTRGDLGAAARSITALPMAWRPGTKLRAPIDYLVAIARALDLSDAPPGAFGALRMLGQPLWGAPQPNGWGDRAADWAGPEAMMRRIDLAYAAGGKGGDMDAEGIAARALGPLLRPETALAVRRAGSRREALALVFSSPEFQRR